MSRSLAAIGKNVSVRRGAVDTPAVVLSFTCPVTKCGTVTHTSPSSRIIGPRPHGPSPVFWSCRRYLTLSTALVFVAMGVNPLGNLVLKFQLFPTSRSRVLISILSLLDAAATPQCRARRALPVSGWAPVAQRQDLSYRQQTSMQGTR
jgi:hypothetical protein